MKVKDLEEGRRDGRRDELDDYRKGIAQYRQMCKQHAAVFAQALDTMMML